MSKKEIDAESERERERKDRKRKQETDRGRTCEIWKKRPIERFLFSILHYSKHYCGDRSNGNRFIEIILRKFVVDF